MCLKGWALSGRRSAPSRMSCTDVGGDLGRLVGTAAWLCSSAEHMLVLKPLVDLNALERKEIVTPLQGIWLV